MFVQKYPRATEAVNKIYDIYATDPPYWIAIPSGRWKNYKRAVKIYWSWFYRLGPDHEPTGELLNRCLVRYRELINNTFVTN